MSQISRSISNNNSNQTFTDRHRSLIAGSQSQCHFCLSRTIIIEQLSRLKQIVEAKNQKIIELQNFIHKLSKMAFMESVDTANSDLFQHQTTSMRKRNHHNQSLPSFSKIEFQEKNEQEIVKDSAKMEIRKQIKNIRLQKDCEDKKQAREQGTNLRIRVKEMLQKRQFHSIESESSKFSEGKVGQMHEMTIINSNILPNLNKNGSNIKSQVFSKQATSNYSNNQNSQSMCSLNESIRGQIFKRMKEINL